MIIEKNKLVSLKYELRLENKEGKIVEITDEHKPLEFVFGSGKILPKFEENLANKKAGETFEFPLAPEEAYGQVNPDSIVDLSKDIMKNYEHMIKIGEQIPLQDQAGNKFVGQVTQIKEETITVDLNHPLAGKNLFFTGTILDVRQATEEEITSGLPHSSCNHDGSCHSCSGGC